MSKSLNKFYSFGEFRLDTEEKLLWQNEKPVSLPPKVMDILCLLVEKQGRIVSKNELMDTVWADSFVEESNLTQSIYTLRRTIGTDENGKSIIETVPRRGFRIAVPVLQNVVEPEVESWGSGIVENDQKSVPNPQLRTPYSRLFIFVPISIAAIFLIALVYKLFPNRSPNSAPLENVTFQKLTFTGDISSPTISPDGKTIAFVKQDSLFLQDINTGSSIKLEVADHKVFGNLRFSNDGEHLYFRNERRTDAGGDIFQVSRFGGAARKILEDSWSGIDFSPDEKKLAFIRYFPGEVKWALFIKNLETNEEKSLFERVSPNSIYRTGFPDWSSDGKNIVTVAQQKPASTIYVINVETGNAEKQETPRFVQIEQTVWTANGSAILLAGRENNRFFQLWRMAFPGGEMQRITNDLSIYRNLSLSADGKSLIAENQTLYSHLWTAEANDLENQKQITFGNLNRDGGAGMIWTPDGNLVYASRITGDVDLWLLRSAGNIPQQLTKNSGPNNENPVISPDGKYIFFESTRTGSRHIWRIETDGSNPVQITFSENDNEYYPALSPDGNYLYFLKKSPQGNLILRQNLVDKSQENITQLSTVSPDGFITPSPDGKMLAFYNIRNKKEDKPGSKTSQIGIVFLEEQKTIKLYNLPQFSGSFVWWADSKGFDYNENNPEGAKIWRKTLDETAEPKQLLTIPKTTIFNFGWSPDHKTLALSRGKQDRDVMLLKNFE